MAQFRPGRFEGDMLLFATTENLHRCSLWVPHVSGNITSHEIRCKHKMMGKPAHMALIGLLLEQYLKTKCGNSTRENASKQEGNGKERRGERHGQEEV